MSRQQRAILSWHVADDERSWHQLTGQPTGGPAADRASGSSRRTPRWWLGALGAVLALLALLGVHLVRQANTGLERVEAELATAVDAERWAASGGSPLALQAVLDPAAPAVWRNRILLEHARIGASSDAALPAAARPLLFGDGVALVQVRERAATGPIYVTHRFYRETAEGWVRTTPRVALWGLPQRRETRFFRFHFYARDAAAVATVAGRIDDFYADLRAELGLPPPDDAEKLAISLTVSATPEFDMLSIYFARGILAIPSPELLPVRENTTPAQALEQTIEQALIRDLFQRREVQFGVNRRWYPLLEGVRLWQLLQASESTAWYGDRVRWLYKEWPAVFRGERALAAGEAEWLCQISTRGTPVVANWLLPDDCGGEEPARLLRIMPLPPQRLADLKMVSLSRAAEEHWVVRWQRRAILASIVDYGVAAYGRDSLRRLFDAMSRYDRWDMLIPAVYGVSVPEFEAGWQAYLRR